VSSATFRSIVEQYFDAEERGDVEGVVDLCDDGAIVRNAAQPPQHGKTGVREYVSLFKSRTERRTFRLLAIAEEGSVVYAWWDADLVFKAGISFGPVVTNRPFQTRLQGVCRFKFAPSGLVEELDVVHETSSVARIASQNAAPAGPAT
jgi:ketosteroid isomerase-like protein